MIEESDEAWRLFRSVFDPRPEVARVREALKQELNGLAELGFDHALSALDGVESGYYDSTISNAVAMSISELADLILELEVVR